MSIKKSAFQALGHGYVSQRYENCQLRHAKEATKLGLKVGFMKRLKSLMLTLRMNSTISLKQQPAFLWWRYNVWKPRSKKSSLGVEYPQLTLFENLSSAMNIRPLWTDRNIFSVCVRGSLAPDQRNNGALECEQLFLDGAPIIHQTPVARAQEVSRIDRENEWFLFRHIRPLHR